MTQLQGTISSEPRPAIAASPSPVNWNAVMTAIVLLGAALRVAQYASRQSYWNDEASLVLNIFDHTARELLGPLEFDQASPPLFLLAMRGMHVLLGRGEYAMRLLPVILSIAALVLFARLARRTLAPLMAAIGLALFAVSNHLITHAAEAKQYSGDVFVATLLLLLAVGGAPTVPAHKRLERVSLAAVVAVWFSHPAAFMFGGIALALGWSALREKSIHAARVFSAMSLPALSFLVLYFVSIRHQQSQMLFNYWGDKFVDYSWKLPLWLVLSSVNLFDYVYDKGGALLLPLGVLGAVHLWRRGRRELLGMLILPILLTLLAAAVRRYPFGGSRLTLFLAPCLLLLVGAGLQMLRDMLAPRVGRWWVAVPVALLAINGSIAAYHLVVPRYRGNMRPVVEYIRQHRKPDEPVFALRHVEFRAYWPDTVDENIHIGNWPKRFPSRGRFWVALSVGQGKDKLKKELRYDQRGLREPMEMKTWRGGAALLYDRSAGTATTRASHE